VQVGAPIALSAAPGETVDDIDAALQALGVATVETSTGATPVADFAEPPRRAPVVSSAHDSSGRVFATPLVRRLARSANLDLRAVAGTGPNGRIVRRDIEAILTEPAPRTPTPQSSEGAVEPSQPTADTEAIPYADEPHSRIRAAIAARLTESKRTAPHFYLRGSCRVDRLLALRGELNADLDKADAIKVSVNHLVVKAAARAHTAVPAMNVIWTEHATRRFDAVDIAVAVASPRGLVTPVVRDVARRSVTAVSRDMADLAARARDGKLAQHEIEGGAFCISNLGMYGTEEFSAIINPPQSAIMAVGAARSEPVVTDGALAVATVMRVTLSVDHRVINGSTAAEWMRAFIGIIENPLQILL
jgi:pyruvate dehydrogenase E2 component (dihydrolipoamide acetyltransferase)